MSENNEKYPQFWPGLEPAKLGSSGQHDNYCTTENGYSMVTHSLQYKDVKYNEFIVLQIVT